VNVENNISKVFGLKDDKWLNHANPISVWTRFIVLPFLILAIWSRVWIGWFSLILIILLIIWIFINPKFFKKPKTFDSWASKCVLGEKILSENKIKIPKHHLTAKNILTAIQGIGSIFLIYGLYKLDFWPTLIGVILVYMGKMWFLDRMVWLYEEMKDKL
jgi:hypothetical protein